MNSISILLRAWILDPGIISLSVFFVHSIFLTNIDEKWWWVSVIGSIQIRKVSSCLITLVSFLGQGFTSLEFLYLKKLIGFAYLLKRCFFFFRCVVRIVVDRIYLCRHIRASTNLEKLHVLSHSLLYFSCIHNFNEASSLNSALNGSNSVPNIHNRVEKYPSKTNPGMTPLLSMHLKFYANYRNSNLNMLLGTNLWNKELVVS